MGPAAARSWAGRLQLCAKFGPALSAVTDLAGPGADDAIAVADPSGHARVGIWASQRLQLWCADDHDFMYGLAGEILLPADPCMPGSVAFDEFPCEQVTDGATGERDNRGSPGRIRRHRGIHHCVR